MEPIENRGQGSSMDLRRLFEIEREALTRIGGGQPIEDALRSMAANVSELIGSSCSVWLLTEDEHSLVLAGGTSAENRRTLPPDMLPLLKRSRSDSDLGWAAGLIGPGLLLPIIGLTQQHLGIWQQLGDATPDARDAGAFAAHIAAVAIERANSDRTLLTRERELMRVQQLGQIGGVEVDLRSGFRNRRSPEYLAIHGLPPSAANETHEAWVARIHPDDRERTENQFKDAVLAGISDYQSEYRIIRPSDGEMR